MFVFLNGKLYLRNVAERVNPAWFSREFTAEESWMFDQECDATMSKLSAGVGSLADALAESLQDEIQYYSQVKQITCLDEHLTVEIAQAGESVTITGDQVVVALPINPVKKVEFVPALSDEKMRMMSKVEYRPGLLAYFQIPTTYWLELGLTGFGVTDTVGEIWTPHFDPKAKHCITIAYLKDSVAEEIMALPEDKRDEAIIARIENVLPEFSSFVQASMSFSWDETPYIKGTRSTSKFFSVKELDALRIPEGKIHFAGEHLGQSYMGWMEGALESASRVVGEIDG